MSNSEHPYLGRCKECDYALFATGEQIKPADSWKDVTAGTGPYAVPNYGIFARCPSRHKVFHLKQIKGTYSESHHCDSRCLNAKGHECTCSCGGLNHGRGYAVQTFADASNLPTPVQAPDTSNSRHLGEVDKHIRGEVTVTKKNKGPQSAHSTLYVFASKNGDVIKWFAPTAVDPDWKVGDTFTLRAKVKRHEDHERFGKSTLVTYAEKVDE